MATLSADQYITRGNLKQAEEQIKREWKVILLLLALYAKPKIPVPAQSPVMEKALKAEAVAKVLLITNEPASLKEVASDLEVTGFQVVAIVDSYEAVQKVIEADLIILDERATFAEDVCAYIRAKSNTPIILLGSDPSGEAWSRAVAMGADAYLKTSISSQELAARVNTILRRYLKTGWKTKDSQEDLNNV